MAQAQVAFEWGTLAAQLAARFEAVLGDTAAPDGPKEGWA
jgi:hypothetical protein